jgi:hypothetical protein
MALAMSHPWKHFKTGIDWLRKGVSDNLPPVAGTWEVQLSLRTKDSETAKREHLKALTDLEAQWENLRAGPETVSEREAHELAQAVHDTWLRAYRDNPSQQTSGHPHWEQSMGADFLSSWRDPR